MDSLNHDNQADVIEAFTESEVRTFGLRLTYLKQIHSQQKDVDLKRGLRYLRY